MSGIIVLAIITGLNIWALTISGGNSLATGYIIFALAAGNFFLAWLLNRFGEALGEILYRINFPIFAYVLTMITFIVFGLINLARFIVPLVY